MQLPPDDGMTHEERKRKVLAQGALYRLGVMEAREVVRENLSAESLAKGALSRVASLATSFMGGGGAVRAIRSLSGGLNLQSLQSAAPLLLTGVSMLTKRGLRKPLLYGGVISAVGALAYYLTRRRDQQSESTPEEGGSEA